MIKVLAIDIVFLLPKEITHSALTINQALNKSQAGFVFNESHLPHLTLLQQFVLKDHLQAVMEAVEKITNGFSPLPLEVSGIEKIFTTSHWIIKPQPDLQRLHRNLISTLAPWALTKAGPEAFYGPEEPPRPADIQWVQNYRSQSSLERFYPHITLGVGEATPLEAPFRFQAKRIALCHLGKFCTCRAILKEWNLLGFSARLP